MVDTGPICNMFSSTSHELIVMIMNHTELYNLSKIGGMVANPLVLTTEILDILPFLIAASVAVQYIFIPITCYL